MNPFQPIKGVQPIVISAPFGNYYQPQGTTPTLGTFTLDPRGGWGHRIMRVLKTLRYFRRPRAWINQLGLPNPGITWLQHQVEHGLYVHDKIISVHGFQVSGWANLVHMATKLRPAAVELNVSCPNVGDDNKLSDYELIFDHARIVSGKEGVPIIVKLGPNGFEGLLELALEKGLRNFHCFNSIPTPRGGLSGKPLLAIYPTLLRYVAELVGTKSVSIIAGGGISCRDDMRTYYNVGADHVALGSMLFHRETRRNLKSEMILRATLYQHDRLHNEKCDAQPSCPDHRPAAQPDGCDPAHPRSEDP